MVLHALHLCSGYGGFELALRLAGVPARTVAHVERDAYAAATLVARMEEAHLDRAPVWSDLTTFDPEPWRGRVDLITAGFPCQPFSSAGQQRGVDDERWLWPAIGRLIGDVGPRLVFLENVPGLVRAGLPHVLSDLARFGFDAEWGLFAASEVGAPHQRERFWLLAHTAGVDGVHGRRQRVEQPERRRQRTGVDRQAVADTDGERSRGQRVPLRGQVDGAEVVGGGTHVGHAGRARPEVPRSTPGHEGPHGPPSGDVADGAGQGVADAAGSRRPQDRLNEPRDSRTAGGEGAPGDAGRRHAHRQWPPGRDDHDGWREWIAQGGPEPAVRRGADGRPAGLADALHLGGNGLVPAVAAAALVELARRLDIDLWEDE